MRHTLITILTALSIVVGTSCRLLPPEKDTPAPEEPLPGGGLTAGFGPIRGEFSDLEVNWLVNHFSEAVCTGAANLVAGTDFELTGKVTRLGQVTAQASVAWDWATPASGVYTPIGTRALNASSATVLGAYPFDFAVDPFTTFNPFAPVCNQTVSAEGTFSLTDDDGDQVTGIITGGEVYELSFGSFPGDGQEQFVEIMITGGTGELFGASGSMVIHSILDFTGPGLVMSEVMEGGALDIRDCDGLEGEFDRFDFSWLVSHFSEQICTGGASLVAGASYQLNANLDPLSSGKALVSLAWDWSMPAAGSYTPSGPRLGNSASASVLSVYPYAFAIDPFSTNNPVAPVCGQTVSATGEFLVSERDGGRVMGQVVGGEVYELAFDIPGDGMEQFVEVEIVEASDLSSGSHGFFVVHSVFKYGVLGIGLLSSEILPGGAICYDD